LVAEDDWMRRGYDPALYWVVMDIPRSARELPRGIATDIRIVGLDGAKNAFVLVRPYLRKSRRPGYRRGVSAGGNDFPMHFQVFALDTKLDLDPLGVTRDGLIYAMEGHVLASGEIFIAGTP
jgi:phosphatidylethanolamine-binding protein (PEBP) family uncharacterized protein